MLLASLSDVFIVGSNAFGPTMQGCWLPTPFASFPFTSPPVRRRVPSGSERAIQYGMYFSWFFRMNFGPHVLIMCEKG